MLIDACLEVKMFWIVSLLLGKPVYQTEYLVLEIKKKKCRIINLFVIALEFFIPRTS
jgi:hypothetical protein